jgi:hypothetical protein
MGFSLKKIRERLVEGDFEYEGQTLHVVVDANAITGRAMEEINTGMADRVKVVTGLETQTAQLHAQSIMLAQIIKSWDAEEGQPTVALLMDQPVGFLSDLLAFCMELSAPKSKTASA